jgi:hypothetical protein
MVARPFKAGTTTTIDCVAERQLMRDRRQSTKKSFMRRSATRCLRIAMFPGVETLVITHEIGLFEVDFRSEAEGNY